MSAATTVQPTGEDKIIDADIPIAVQIIENTAEPYDNLFKAFKYAHCRNCGKTISADVSREPARFIARTIMTAHTIEIAAL